jgi:hypothetical protein
MSNLLSVYARPLWSALEDSSPTSIRWFDRHGLSGFRQRPVFQQRFGVVQNKLAHAIGSHERRGTRETIFDAHEALPG